VRLIIIRHGQTSSNTRHLLDTGYPGAPLNEVGLAQARALVGALAGEPIEAIMASDLTRARQTAEPLAAARGLEIIEHPGLREIYAGDFDMDVDWEPYLGLIQAWPADPANPDRRIPGGESAAGFFQRFDGAVRQLAETGYGCAALVSHGGALLTWLFGRAAGLPHDDPGRLALGNTANLVLEDGGGSWRVERWADR
jgi:probable phosphoglycerate mutase